MKKQPSTSKPISESASVDTRTFSRVFLVEGTDLTLEPRFPEGAEPKQKQFKSSHEFERFVSLNWKLLFGERTIGIGARAEGLLYPFEAFLFDFSEAKPRCYFLLVYLSGETFAETFMKSTRSFAYLRDPDLIRSLIDNLTENIEKDKQLRKGFVQYIGEQAIPEFIEEMIAHCRLLLITDENTSQYPDLVKAYSETWEALLDIIYLQKYQVGKQVMLSMHPELADFREKPNEAKSREPKVIHTEDHHFAKGSETVRAIYKKLKEAATKLDENIVFNPQGRHYIGMKKPGGKNLAFFHLRRSSVYLVVMRPHPVAKSMVKHHELKALNPSVKSFWGGECCAVVIDKAQHLSEVIALLKKAIGTPIEPVKK